MASMRSLEGIVVECAECNHRVTIEAEVLESRLDRPLSMASVGSLWGRMRCGRCGTREIRISDAAGRALIDPAAITPCRTCGCPIPLPRLEALPDTDVCVLCREEEGNHLPAPPHPQPPANERKCPRCGSPTVVRQNSDNHEFFLGCTSFPKCRWTRSMDDRH